MEYVFPAFLLGVAVAAPPSLLLGLVWSAAMRRYRAGKAHRSTPEPEAGSQR